MTIRTVTFVTAIAVFLAAIAVVGCSRAARVFREAETLMSQVLLDYAHGSFASASNSLKRYTAYLDANEHRIASYRDYDAVDLNGKEVPFPVRPDIPVVQFAPHSMLACMMIYAGNTNEASHHLSRAYQYHVQIWTRAERSPLPRADFVQSILDYREKIDAKTGAAWKEKFELDTNVVNGIAEAWVKSND